MDLRFKVKAKRQPRHNVLVPGGCILTTALDTAIFTLAELKASRYGHPNQITYGTFFKALANLVPDDDKFRRAVIKESFQQCCNDGQVGDMVLSQLRAAAPADLFEELVVAAVQETSSRKDSRHVRASDLPAKWRSNVRAGNGSPRPASLRRNKGRHQRRSRS